MRGATWFGSLRGRRVMEAAGHVSLDARCGCLSGGVLSMCSEVTTGLPLAGTKRRPRMPGREEFHARRALVSLAVALLVLAIAVALGGLAAAWRDHGRRVVPGIGTFATVAAAGVALLHLLPEAVVEGGVWTLIPLVATLFVPVVLERRMHEDQASPSVALVAGYVAVLVHQAGEGTAIATMAQTNELRPTLVVAIAAHTIPLAMVVALRALTTTTDTRRGVFRAALTLAGCAIATVVGALSVQVIDASAIEKSKPWLVAAVAGLLLHALFHAPKRSDEVELRHRITDIVAGLVGLSVAVLSLEPDGWVRFVPWPLRIALLLVLIAAVIIRGFVQTNHAEAR